jgi:dipeptidyl aminopeptidase/acylaminoacyl peptidase
MKNRLRRYAAIGLVLSCFVVVLAGQRRPMTVDDALNLITIESLRITPDGSHILFVKSVLDWKENKYRKTPFMTPTAGGPARQYIGEAGGSDFHFSPDGHYLAFKREVEEKEQIFLMPTGGGEAVPLTKHKTAVAAFRWSPVGDRLFFSADEARDEEEEKEYEAGDDAIFVDEGPNGQGAGRWRNLWSIDLESREEIRLTEEEFIVGSFDPAPDGTRVAFTARRENRRNQEYLSEIYLLETDTGQITRLTDNEAPETDPRWAPDGRLLAFLAPDAEQWALRHRKVHLLNPETKTIRLVSGGFQGDVLDYFWLPEGGGILVNGLVGINSNLYRLDVAEGSVVPLTDVEGSVKSVSVSRDGRTVGYLRADFHQPADLYASTVDAFDPLRLTDLNPWFREEIETAVPRVVSWRSRDGLEIEGLLFLPAETERPPLLLHIHGGPAAVFPNDFSARYHIWAGLGYASLCPNVRGSRGYGDEFLRANMHDIGGGDFEDLMTGVDHLIARGLVDPERMGVRGWSYGGILGGWTITQTDRFKAASLGAMVSDWTSEYGPGFNYDVRRWYIGGTPWENPEPYRERSSLTHIANVNTPTLLLHGMEDPVCTEPQSMMFFTALKDRGVPARYVRFPREKHSFEEPRHQRRRDIEEIRWMQEHVLGLDWAPWERKDEQDKVGKE